MSPSDLGPERPCDRVYSLLVDGEEWKRVRSCEVDIEDAILSAGIEASRRMMEDGREHTHGVHLHAVVRPERDAT